MTKLYPLILILLASQINLAQENCTLKQYVLKFNVIEKNTRHGISAPFIEIRSGNKTIGFASGDFDGHAESSICSEKIKKDSITLKVFGIGSAPKIISQKVNDTTFIQIEVDYGIGPFNNLEERSQFIMKEYKLPFCGLDQEFK
ncbi:MAG: hypothetical protein CMP76_02935 [Flavobacterium sp.]|uniref:hypothetical protein n=1 Tax=Flavobacterium sp. TaxID=239 RepID=UPI000C699CB8|nr:hypothetical protein [Flavobacterium sp.]MBF02232.1 hypothetical protein [Flavobacterium sp.]|tara:strand:- start:290 stop:721 length:432 start_codon:yes stop_codon:yes gene_type:complete